MKGGFNEVSNNSGNRINNSSSQNIGNSVSGNSSNSFSGNNSGFNSGSGSGSSNLGSNNSNSSRSGSGPGAGPRTGANQTGQNNSRTNTNLAKATVGATAANVATNVANNASISKSGPGANANIGKGLNSSNGNNDLFENFQLIGEITFGKVIFFLVILYVVLMIAFLLSENYRVNSTIIQLDKYNNAMLLNTMYLLKNKRRDKTLKEFHIASSFRPYMAINQLLEYSSEKLITRNVQNGVRCMYLDIFNDTLGENAYPVVSSGYEKGNWQLTLNSLRFETVIKELSKTVFTSGYAPNYNDPFILMLNLKTNKNHKCLNRIQEVLYKYFKNKLLPSKYSYQSRTMADAPMRDLMGKLVILTSQGYENSNLEELINGSWNTEYLKQISYKSLDSETSRSEAIKMNIDDVRTFNNNGLTLVLPEEETFFTYNYDPSPFFTSGCQFIFMNYQLNNLYMEPYITKFKNSSFVEKS
jgi:hypothetical protein